jgi:hypothetical protein
VAVTTARGSEHRQHSAPSTRQTQLYVWLDGEPGATPPDVTIADEPGVSDLDQIADAIVRGDLGRYLPVTIRFAGHARPSPQRVRSLDTARLLRERHIRHRRRYEVMLDSISEA